MSTVNDICQIEAFCRTYTFYVSIENSNSTATINVSASANKDRLTILDYLEYTCIAWFTLEFTIRFLVAPDRIEFMKSPLNWIDFGANLWFYSDLVYNQMLDEYNKSTHPAWDLFGTVRIFRLFKFINHHKGLKIIIASLKASASILRLLIFFVGVAIIIFASLIYYSEKLAAGRISKISSSHQTGSNSRYGRRYVNDNEFTSIVEAIWFSIASLTTVGFGDYVPKTAFGMIFGAICTVSGVLMIDLPMPIIVQNFANYYNHLQARSKLPKKLRRRVIELPRNFKCQTGVLAAQRMQISNRIKFHSTSPEEICITQPVLNAGSHTVGFNKALVIAEKRKNSKFDIQNTTST